MINWISDTLLSKLMKLISDLYSEFPLPIVIRLGFIDYISWLGRINIIFSIKCN